MTMVSLGITYSPLAEALPGFPETVVKSTLLLGLVLALAGLMKHASASSRHLLWGMGIVGALLIPVLSQTIPWRLPVLPAPRATAETGTPDFSKSSGPVDLSAGSEAGTEATAIGSADSAVAGVFFKAGSEGLVPEETGGRPAAAGERSSLFGSLWSRSAVIRSLVSVWLAGAIGLLGWMILGTMLVRRIVRRGTPLRDYRWVQLMGAASEEMGVVIPVRLVRSGALPMPVTSGVVRPVVILPEGSESWDQDRRRAVLMHELAHVRRHDLIFHMMARAACALYWFHPLVWYAARRLRAESERACDDLVLNAGTRASDYADHLLHIVRSAGSSRTPAAAVPMAQRSEFEGRLLAILDSGAKRHGLSLVRALAMLLALAVSTIPLAALSRADESRAAAKPVGVDSATVVPGDTEDERPLLRRAETPVVLAVAAAGPSGEETRAPVDPDQGGVEVETRAQQGAVDPVAALIKALDDPDRQVRMTALQALAGMEDPRALPGAMRALTSDDADMRIAALRTVAHLGDSRALPEVLPLLRDSDHRVRLAAASAIGEFQDTTAIEALSSALRNDVDAEVRKTAAWALGEIADARALPALIEALGGDTSAEVRATAAWALGEIEDPAALDALGAAVRDENDDVRRGAIRAIGEIDDRRAVPVLVPLLDDADPEVRKLSVWALGELEDPASVEALGKATRDEEAEVRRMAVRGLGEVEDPAALDYLVATLQDDDAEVRAYSAWALGEIEDVRALEPLVQAVGDPIPEVRSQAVHALGHLEDARAEEGLSRALTDEHVDVRRQAANALGDLDLSVAPPALLAAMDDPAPDVRKLAARSLGEIGDPAATDALAAGVADQNREVRLVSLQSLGEMGTQRSLEILVQAMNSEDAEVRRVAARMLGRRGDR